jgi:polar amino acid transport system substrate-binding protein
MAEIKKQGYLSVATSGDVYLWGSTDTATGDPVGYDVDLATEIAKKLGVTRIVYTVIPYSQRQSVLGNKQVDLVAQQMTITCDRWSGTPKTASAAAAPGINLSIPYYVAGAKFLVRSDSTVRTIKDLDGETVCGTAGSTSLKTVANVAGVKTVVAASAGLCLVKFEEGEATAIVADETTLAGFQAQDPRSKIVGVAISPGPYGLGTQPNEPEFTRFVNAVLVQLRSDGTLIRLYNKWMRPTVRGSAPVLPAPVYGRDITGLKRAS